jgi:hypothetical protein
MKNIRKLNKLNQKKIYMKLNFSTHTHELVEKYMLRQLTTFHLQKNYANDVQF